MNDRTAVSRVVRIARQEAAPIRRDDGGPRQHVRLAEPTAQVMLLPGRFRDDAYVARHVEFVLSLDSERGEQHVARNLNAIRRRLDEIGVDPAVADREIRGIEARVRAELWKQVLTPSGER